MAKMNREDVLSVLNTLKPAVSSDNTNEVLQHFWFDGSVASAYNGVIGIEAPFKTDFKGGVPGQLLHGMLSNTFLKEITLEPGDKKSVALNAGQLKAKFALLEYDQFGWPFGELPKGMYAMQDDIVQALNRTLINVERNIDVPDERGVTIIPKDEVLNFYSTDSKTVTWTSAAKPKGYKAKRVILPADFCEQLLVICKDGGKFIIKDDLVCAENEHGICLYAHILESPAPHNFEDVIANALPKGYEKKLTKIPDRLGVVLDRVAILYGGLNNQPSLFTADDKTLKIYAKTPYGEIKDAMKLEGAHGAIEASLEPMLIKRALPLCENFLISDACMIMTGGASFIHFISKVVK